MEAVLGYGLCFGMVLFALWWGMAAQTKQQEDEWRAIAKNSPKDPSHAVTIRKSVPYDWEAETDVTT